MLINNCGNLIVSHVNKPYHYINLPVRVLFEKTTFYTDVQESREILITRVSMIVSWNPGRTQSYKNSTVVGISFPINPQLDAGVLLTYRCA